MVSELLYSIPTPRGILGSPIHLNLHVFGLWEAMDTHEQSLWVCSHCDNVFFCSNNKLREHTD